MKKLLLAFILMILPAASYAQACLPKEEALEIFEMKGAVLKAEGLHMSVDKMELWVTEDDYFYVIIIPATDPSIACLVSAGEYFSVYLDKPNL